MAEEVKRIYKYKDAEMDRDSFIKNLNHNYSNYVDSQSWTDDQKRAFRDAYDAHIEALKKGMLESDIDGSLIVMHDDGDNRFGNGVTEHYNKKGVAASNYDDLKKRKKRKFNDSFYANREVVSYFDTIADALYNKKYASKESEKDELEKSEPRKIKFRSGNNDVLGAFIHERTNGTGNFYLENWLRYDKDENGNFNEKNPYENRLNAFYNFIERHIKDDEFFDSIDYSNTPSKDAEGYKKRLIELRDFIKPTSDWKLVNLKDHDNKRKFYDLLQNLGVVEDDAHLLFTGKGKKETKETSTNPQGEQAASGNTSNQDNSSDANSEQSIKLASYIDDLDEDEISNIENYEEGLLSAEILRGRDANSCKNHYDLLVSYLYNKYFSDNASDYLKSIVKKVPRYSNVYYIPISYNIESDDVIAFNSSGMWFYISPSKLGLTKKDLGLTDSNAADEVQSEKSGGILRAGYLGDGGSTDKIKIDDAYMKELIEWANKQNGKKPGDDGYIPISGDNPKENDDEKWTWQDYTRLGALALDIGALFDPESFSSCGLSFAGSAADLAADLGDNVSRGKAWGNFGINAALSTIALVPVVGGAAKLGRISSKFVKYAGEISNWLVKAGRFLLPTGAIIAIRSSLNKVMQDGGIKNLNKDDLRNLYTVLTAIVSTRNMGRGVAKIKGKSDLTTADNLEDIKKFDVKLKGKYSGKKERFIIDDDDLVKSIRTEYIKNNPDATRVNNLLQNKYKGYELASEDVKSAIRPGDSEDILKNNLQADTDNNILKQFGWWQKYGPFSTRTDLYRYLNKEFKKINIDANGSKIIKAKNGTTVNNNQTEKPFYGTDYIGQKAEYYIGGGYGGTPVNLSDIEDKSNNGLNLIIGHGTNDQPFEYNWKNVQESADVLKNYWQNQDGARQQSILNAAQKWLANPNNKDKTQAAFLTYYNNLIDSMYKFKRNIANGKYHAGENGFITDDDVKAFNEAHNTIYNSQYATKGENTNNAAIFSYNEDVSDMFGAATGARDIDTTEGDIALDFSSLSDAIENNENLKGILQGLNKDKFGRLFINKPAEDENGREARRERRKERRLKAAQAFNDKLPEAIDAAKYIASRRTNRRVYDISKKMPILLHNPEEARRSVVGDISAIQQGYKNAGMLNHVASTPLTSDANLQTATMLNAAIKGQDYINAGYKTNADAISKSSEQNWTQERANQKSRYTVAENNRENILSKKVNVLTEKAKMLNSNYESLNSWLTGIETDLRDKRDKKEEYEEALIKESIQNDVLNNLKKYGITNDPKMQDLINALSNGTRKYSELEPDEQAAVNKIRAKAKEVILAETAKQKGIKYTPRITNNNGTEIKRMGGIIPKDTEKVTIQKLRGQIQKMQARMKYYENNVKAAERALERADRFASNYIKQQTRSK